MAGQQYQWAVGTNAEKARPVSRADQKDPDYTLVWVPTSRLTGLMDSSQKKTLDPNKLGRAMNFWKDGGFMEPPVASIYDDHVVYADGRHRVMAAQRLGIQSIPLIVPANEVDSLKKLTGTVSPRQPLTSGRTA